ncbi:MAG: D-amino acid dehydrogenase [Rhodospirillaceae bacterium]|nr:D-amino acid dehydrogenase [Rhodospirillaceae bacterium]
MKTIVLGGGVVGTATAYYLARLGHEVELVDRADDLAMETSFANGGVLHTSEVEPWSRPGMPRNILRWLGREDAPMLLRTSELPRIWRWGLDFVRNCTAERYRRHMRVNLRLSLYTLQCIQAIREETGIDYDLMRKGTMKVYTRPEALEQARRESELMRPHGMQFEVADARRCVAIEPALAPIESTLAGGLYYPIDEHGDCHKFTTRLGRYCESRLGVKLRLGTEVRRLLRAGDRIEAVETSRGRLVADNYVAALGSYTPRLLGPLGIRIPIYPAKGVTVTVPAAAWPDGPQVPIIDDSRLFGLIRIGDRYRCSGSVEFTGYDRSVNPARAKAIVDNVISVFPRFADCYDPQTAVFWSGLRPMAPSGNPYLGPTPIRNLFVNAGHGHLGWTMSCGSGAAVADMVAGRKPQIDMTGLTLDTHD